MTGKRAPTQKEAKTVVALVSTGGTIEKTYDEMSGVLANQVSVLDVMLASLDLRGVKIVRVPLMNKDSRDMTDADHNQIAQVALRHAQSMDGVVVVHGTDRLSVTGERISDLGDPGSAIVLTGAMRPYELRKTDALQNMTEALLAVQLLPSGVYVAMQNRVLKFPGVIKDNKRGMFVRHPGA